MAETPQTLIEAPDRTVLQEDGQPWPKEGLPDPGTLYTRRRLRDGDLIVVPEPAAPAAKPAAAAPAATPTKTDGDAK